jgi:hypothetical protein
MKNSFNLGQSGSGLNGNRDQEEGISQVGGQDTGGAAKKLARIQMVLPNCRQLLH